MRTEADEVNYNLHIMLRFDLEYALISEKIQVDQIEDFWNERFSQDFDMVITKPTDGVLQDVHWSVGAFGYFPGYTLGNIYSACLINKMKDDILYCRGLNLQGIVFGLLNQNKTIDIENMKYSID